MDITTCPSCGRTVLPKLDGTCPACQHAFGLAAQTPIVAETNDIAPVVSRAALVESVVRKYRAEEAAHRLPAGLALLALIQFGFVPLAGIVFFGAIGVIAAQTEKNVDVGEGRMYLILGAMLALGLLILSGIGYLTQNRIFGYWGGNILAVGWILFAVFNGALHGFAHFSYRDMGVLYPIFLLCVLNLRYRKKFE